MTRTHGHIPVPGTHSHPKPNPGPLIASPIPKPPHSHGNELREKSVPISTPIPIPALPSARPVLNLYEPDSAPSTLWEKRPMHLYDINFLFPFHVLQTDHVRLEPLVPSKHLDGFLGLPEESWMYLGDLGPFDRTTALKEIEAFRSDPQCLLLAVTDLQAERAGSDAFAGIYGFIEASDEYMDTMFGVINLHPRYHRTHINSHAMYLALSYLFDQLHLVRVQYDAVTHNTASIRSAERFGFKPEGIARNLNGLVPASKKRKGEEGRHSQDLWISSMTDYEWDNQGRERLREMTQRPVVDTTTLRG